MMLFRSNEKAYNLDYKIGKRLREEIKIDDSLTYDNEEKLINLLADWHIKKMDHYSNYYENDLLKIANEDTKILLDMFDMNSFMEFLKGKIENYEYDKFENNYTYRRNIMYVALLQIIKNGGAYKGSEYGLIFSKAFNFDYATSMMYASYDSSMLNERFIEFLNKYLEIGGSLNTYWLPNYFSNNTKNKYDMEPLYEVYKYTKMFGNEKILHK